MRRQRQSTKKDANFLPTAQGEAFVAQLDSLIESLAESYGGFKERYLLQEYRSKYVDSSTTSPGVRRSRAIEKWLATEERNRTTNIRLLIGDEDFGWCNSSDLIEKARIIISKILGPFHPELCLSSGCHTNGASTRVRRSPKAAVQKHVGKAHGTEKALYLYCLSQSGSMLAEQVLEPFPGSMLFTVPKSTDIDRVACKEPEINMFLQRQIGLFIRRRLRVHGVDLNDQTVNQRLAQRALSEGLATLDLSSASDSISRQLVMVLLPFEWWSILEDLRVHRTLIDDQWHELEMFSSMGNGFTFELESLLFYALLRAIAWQSGIKGRISVFGDDLVVPKKLARRVKRIFAWFGFTVNAKKSHWSGKFRESCGKHYYNSREVTPFYLREPVRKKTDIIRILNRLLVWDSAGLKCLTTPEVIEFHYKWRSVIPSRVHGGQDPDFIGALVTGDPPADCILRRKEEIAFDQAGGLLYWLTAANSIARYRSEPLVVSPKVEGKGIFQPLNHTGHSSWDPYLLLVREHAHTPG